MPPGGHIFWVPPLIGGEGGGGTPFIFRIFFFTKSCGITISIKSISRNDVLFAELGAMIISAKGGGLPKPPL